MKTKLELDGRDTALVFKEDGKLEVHLSKLDEVTDASAVTNQEILTVALAELLKDPKFVGCVVEQYELNLERNKQADEKK